VQEVWHRTKILCSINQQGGFRSLMITYAFNSFQLFLRNFGSDYIQKLDANVDLKFKLEPSHVDQVEIIG